MLVELIKLVSPILVQPLLLHCVKAVAARCVCTALGMADDSAVTAAKVVALQRISKQQSTA